MFKVKLIKGLSYTGAIKVTKANPYAEVEKKETADALVATGYFEIVEITEDKAPEVPADPAVTGEPDAAEEQAAAKPKKKASKKAEADAKVDEAEAPAETASEGEADYGEGE